MERALFKFMADNDICVKKGWFQPCRRDMPLATYQYMAYFQDRSLDQAEYGDSYKEAVVNLRQAEREMTEAYNNFVDDMDDLTEGMYSATGSISSHEF